MHRFAFIPTAILAVTGLCSEAFCQDIIYSGPILEASQRPVVVTQRPVVVTQRPVVVTQRPVVVTQRPVVVTQRPVVVTQRPVVVTRRPLVSHQLGTGYYRSPLVTTYRPTAPMAYTPIVTVPIAPVLVRPKVYIPGQPLLNLVRAITP